MSFTSPCKLADTKYNYQHIVEILLAHPWLAPLNQGSCQAGNVTVEGTICMDSFLSAQQTVVNGALSGVPGKVHMPSAILLFSQYQEHVIFAKLWFSIK
jgi:hypothetical protein